jgi:hypothetical protein
MDGPKHKKDGTRLQSKREQKRPCTSEEGSGGEKREGREK